jgi:pimeloyl-ACP methyl ester carboxylesterase
MSAQSSPRTEIDLPAGRIRYRDSGEGKPVVFVHGYLVDGRLWDGVVDALSDRCRCLAPDWPIGAQQIAMSPDADLTPYGVVRTIADFLEALDLDDVTIVGNDSGGAMSQVLVTRHPERIGRLVLTNCDTHENFPPGIFKTMPPIAALPGGMSILAAPFRIPPLARAAFRPFTNDPIAPDLIASWMRPGLENPGVKHDAKKVTVGMNKRYTLEAAERLRNSDLPVLLAWAPGDRLFPLKYAERLASDTPNARIAEIADAKTFVPIDQPQRVAEEIAGFAAPA